MFVSLCTERKEIKSQTIDKEFRLDECLKLFNCILYCEIDRVAPGALVGEKRESGWGSIKAELVCCKPANVHGLLGDPSWQ